MKHTLRSKVIDDVAPYLEADGTISSENFHQVKKLHTNIVKKAISRASENRVIDRQAPPVNSNENHLPRVIRVTLSQLCSGICATWLGLWPGWLGVRPDWSGIEQDKGRGRKEVLSDRQMVWWKILPFLSSST